MDYWAFVCCSLILTIFSHLIVTCLGCFSFVLLFVLGGVWVWEGVMCLCEFRGCGVYVVCLSV